MMEAGSVHVVVTKADHAPKSVEVIKTLRVDVTCFLPILSIKWMGWHSHEAQETQFTSSQAL
jgi:hypothetical protein